MLASPQHAVTAAIDIGSNSVHLLVAAVDASGIRPLLDRSEILSLGEIVDRDRRLPDASVVALLESLRRLLRAAAEAGAGAVVLLGTEPIRRAANRDEVERQVMAATRLRIELLSHHEEGLLTLLGVTLGRPVRSEILVADVGGGSTEYIVAAPGLDPRIGVLHTGSLRLTTRFVRHDPPTRRELDAMRDEARGRIAGAIQASPDSAVLVGGTATNLVKVSPSGASDAHLDSVRLATAVEALLSEPAALVAARHGIHERRARLLPAGAAIVEALLERYRPPVSVVSAASLRDGAVLVLARAGPDWRAVLSELAAGPPDRYSEGA